MWCKIRFALLLTMLMSVNHAWATIDYLVVNHTTKQLYWAETDHPPGWIGWEAIPDGIMYEREEQLLKAGYSMTINPFLLEQILLSILIVAFLIFRFWKRRSRLHVESTA